MFIAVFDDDKRAESGQELLRAAGHDVFRVNDCVLLVRSEGALTEDVAITARIKGADRIESRGVVFELGRGRSGWHKAALWEWLGR